MKSLILKIQVTIGVLLFSLVTTQFAYSQTQQDGLGLPGDNLNLSAVLDLFQQSKTLEEFEASLNSDSYKINNLDLNYDGRTDYIKVNDFPDGNLHSIVMQVDINRNESQDVAVIYTEKRSNGFVDIQIVGDEDLYGKNYVIDLGNSQNNATPNPGYSGNVVYDYGYDNYVSPSNWNIIVYMYSPSYSRWYSPWYWGYYPRWWSSWSPFFWNDYYYHCYNNYGWRYRNYCYGYRNRFHNHHSNWYGRNRRHSDVYHNNRQRGVYTKTYQGRPPVRKPMAGKVVPVSQNLTQSGKLLNKPATNINRESGRINPQGTRSGREQLQSQRGLSTSQTRQLPASRVDNNRPQNIERPQQQLRNQEINRPQQQSRSRETERVQPQSRQQQMNRQEMRQQPERRQELSRPQPERRQEYSKPQPRQEVNRPQPQPRQELSRPQPERRQEISRPQPRQEFNRPERVQGRQQAASRPEPRQQMSRQEAKTGNAAPRQAPQPAQTRNDHSMRGGRNR